MRQVPTRVWGITYLAMIPSFALVFWLLPERPFYHSTIQYESTLNEDAGPLLRAMRATIIANFRACHHGDFAAAGRWILDVKDLEVYALRPTPEEIEFKASIVLTRPSKQRPPSSMTRVPFAMSYSASERTFSLASARSDTVRTFYKFLSFKPEQITLYPDAEQRFDWRLLFPQCSGMIEGVAVLSLPEEQNEKIQDFWRAARGLPTKASGGFARMLYFSAMTITTVGYGDIVPITTAARLLVAAEAILGIIVIGLFLNSLAQSWQKAR